MYFAYVDETGIDGKSPVLVMVGIVVNDERLGRTQEEFASIFTKLGESVTGTLRELKSADLLVGRGVWRHLDNTVRCNVITNLCTWVTDRKHGLALAAIHLETFRAAPPAAPELGDAWQAAAWHIALQLQRAHQPMRKNKGKTILVFDDNKHGIANVADSIYDPPAWTDDYYERGKKQGALDQLIDTPFAVKSHHVGLVQIADLYAAIFRRYAELTDHDDTERYPGETRHIVEWIELLVPRLIAKASRWPARSKSECAQWYVNVAPRSLLALQ